MLNMALLLCVVNEGEHIVVNQVVEEVTPSVEVGSDNYGPRFHSNKSGKSSLNPSLVPSS